MAVQFETLVAALSNRYRIERQLGEGGMATVYLAQFHAGASGDAAGNQVAGRDA